MKREVLQFDLVQFDASKVETTPQGFLKIPANFTGVGVFPYRDPNNPKKIIQRLRRETEVFKPESMKTLEDAPYTKRHPPSMLGPANVAEFRKGHVSGPVVKVGAKLLGGHVIVQDQDAIEDIRHGVKQLSCGYLATIDDTGGTWHDPDLGMDLLYDDEQIDIVYNHVAGVPTGRQGPDKTLLLDRKEVFLQDGLEFDIPVTTGHQGGAMKRKLELLDGTFIEVEMDDDSFGKIHKAMGKLHDDISTHQKATRDLKTMCDDYKEQLEKVKAEKKTSDDAAEKLKAQVDTITREVEKLKKSTTDAADPKVLTQLATARASKIILLNHLTKPTKDGKKLSMQDAAEKTDAELMKMVIIASSVADGIEAEKVTADLKDKSDIYIQATYDAIDRREKKTIEDNMNLGGMLVTGRHKAAEDAATPDALDPNLRSAGRSAAIPNKKKKQTDDDDKTKDDKIKDDDKTHRDKMEGKYKDYKPAASKDGKRTR